MNSQDAGHLLWFAAIKKCWTGFREECFELRLWPSWIVWGKDLKDE
jgi:hypothetical protein